MILNTKIQIPNEVFEYFAAEPASPLFSVGQVADAVRVPIHPALSSLLAEVPTSEVELVLADPQFQFFAQPGDPNRQARIWFIERLLMDEIPRRKLALLRAERRAARPRPYDIPALADLEPDDDHLVPLSAFERDGARLLRNGYAFTILTTTPSPNSTHWLLGAIASEGVANTTSVRLDPYLFGPEASYPAMFYKMWMYGRPLDWERIGRLRAVEHGEWRPGPLSRESSFTQFCWSPRDGEVHFVCEEVPKPESISREAAHYLVYARRLDRAKAATGSKVPQARSSFSQNTIQGSPVSGHPSREVARRSPSCASASDTAIELPIPQLSLYVNSVFTKSCQLEYCSGLGPRLVPAGFSHQRNASCQVLRDDPIRGRI